MFDGLPSRVHALIGDPHRLAGAELIYRGHSEWVEIDFELA